MTLTEAHAPRHAGALERIFDEHHALVFRAAYRVTGNATDAEDVLQTVFLRLARQDLSSLSNPGGYLRRAALNCALDVVRARRAAATVPIDEEKRIETAAAPAPDAMELSASLRAALARLKPAWAEMFALRYLEEYDNHEIARMLGVSRALVAVTLHRVRGRLKKDLAARARGMR